MNAEPNCFLALRLDPASVDRLAALSERLRAWDLPAAWTHALDYHLTLHFLGRLSAIELDAVPLAVELVASHLRRPSGLRFAGLGASGGRERPRAVFAACADPEGICAGMGADLAEALGEDDHVRPAHVTICRPLEGRREVGPGGGWPDMLAAFGAADWGPCGITHLALCQSGPGLPRYRELVRWELAG
jgi:2'-5' RNA ligase